MASSFPMKKNTATKIVFPILDADGDLVSAAAGLDSEYSLDGAAFADCTNEATEIGTNGIYYLNLVAAETNGDVACIQVKTTTAGAKTTVLVFYTAAQTLDEVDTNVDTLVTRVPAEVAQKAHLVDGTGDITPPTNKGIWDSLGDGTNIITEINANETKIDTVDTVVDAIKLKTDLLPSGVPKNVALTAFEFLMVLSSDHVTSATGKTVSGQISKDGAAFANLTNAVAEVANGIYKVDITQAEMNANVITLKFTATDCDQRTITILTSD